MLRRPKGWAGVGRTVVSIAWRGNANSTTGAPAPPPPPPAPILTWSPPPSLQPAIFYNHLEDRLLDQAQARVAYTPLFGGHSRSIHQGMILDVQPLVKSLFCPIRPSPNGFFDSEASIPRTRRIIRHARDYAPRGDTAATCRTPSPPPPRCENPTLLRRRNLGYSMVFENDLIALFWAIMDMIAQTIVSFFVLLSVDIVRKLQR